MPNTVLDTGHPLLNTGLTTEVFGDQQEARMLRAERRRRQTRRKRLRFKLQRETERNWKRSYGGHMAPRKRSLPWSQEPHPLGSSKEAVVQESAEQEKPG